MNIRPALLLSIFMTAGCQTSDLGAEALRTVIENGGTGDFCCINFEGKSKNKLLGCRIEAKDESVSNPEIVKFYSTGTDSVSRPVIIFEFQDGSRRTFAWVDSFELADLALVDPWGYKPKFVDGEWPEIDWESGLEIWKSDRIAIKAMDCNAKFRRNVGNLEKHASTPAPTPTTPK